MCIGHAFSHVAPTYIVNISIRVAIRRPSKSAIVAQEEAHSATHPTEYPNLADQDASHYPNTSIIRIFMDARN